MITGANNSEILTIKEPDIERKTISEEDFAKDSKFTASTEKTEGLNAPIIRINTLNIESDDIIKFRISSFEFLPSLDLVFLDNNDLFVNDFPKDGDLVEVYIRSRNDNKFKKIRTDFDIINVGSQINSDGKTIYSISGVLKVPDLFSEQQLSLKSDSAFNHLIELCDLTGLGFASNEVGTNDEMPRFSPNITIKDFIKDIVGSCYKDDDSFFTSYIDIYDYLCFVNVNSTFSLDTELEDGTIDGIAGLVQDKGDAPEGLDSKIFFTNHPNMDNSTSYIRKYSLFNNSGEVWMNYGYKSFCGYYDIEDSEYYSFFVDPLTTKGAEKEQVILKGKAGDNSYERQNRFKYMGRNFSTLNNGNLHPNYHFAKTLNKQNLLEINKMGLNIELSNFSSNIYKYKRIPVVIFNDKGVVSKSITKEKEREQGRSSGEISNINEQDLVQDNFLTGFYVVKGFSINWNNETNFSQSVTLIRREWPEPNSTGIAKKS